MRHIAVLHLTSHYSKSINISHQVRASSAEFYGLRGLTSTGLFMGLMATFVFLIILYVGFSALASLQVPYAAFEKDTSANVQKKQQ
jgi:hypothetical protein